MSDEKNKQRVNYFFALSSFILSHGEWHGKKNRAAPCPAIRSIKIESCSAGFSACGGSRSDKFLFRRSAIHAERFFAL